MSTAPHDAATWTAALSDPVGAALAAREDVLALMPWWWRPLRRMTFLHAIEVYVRSVLVAYYRGQIEGWPPAADGTPTVDMALQPRRRAARRRRVVREAS